MFALSRSKGVTAWGSLATHYPFILRLKRRAVFVSIAVIIVRTVASEYLSEMIPGNT
jgi:hypothetical protein